MSDFLVNRLKAFGLVSRIGLEHTTLSLRKSVLSDHFEPVSVNCRIRELIRNKAGATRREPRFASARSSIALLLLQSAASFAQYKLWRSSATWGRIEFP